jgi:NADH dehydrogenase
MGKPRVVIVGGGFGGLTAAQSLRRSQVEIVLIDRTNHHLFQPLLYQVATAALSPADIASPLRTTLRGQNNVRVLLGEVTAIDRHPRTVILDPWGPLQYDILILAPGSRHHYFGKDEWEHRAPGLKTLSDALQIRQRLLLSFELAEPLGASEARKYLTFVIVGGGPTGVELAGALAEIARKAMTPDYPTLTAKGFSIFLLEAGPRLLPAYPPEQSEQAKDWLLKMGVRVLVDSPVTGITDQGIQLASQFIETVSVIWAAGNRASPLLESLKEPLDRTGRVPVQPDLSLKTDPWIFVIGDAAYCIDGRGQEVPALAPAAIQEGRHVAGIIDKNIPAAERPAFVYHDRGSLATIGRAKALGQIAGIRVSGLLAWLIWSLVHIFFLIGFRNRFRVMSEWVWYYLTYRPGAQLIYRSIRKAGEQDTS